jgi:hypothetical protein
MENDDPEARIADLERQVAEQKRIAELERQLAAAKAAAGQYENAGHTSQSFLVQGRNAGNDRGLHYAESLLDGLRTGQPSPSGGPSADDLARIREGLASAAAQAGMSQEQLDNALRHASVTPNEGLSVVYPQQNTQFRAGSSAGPVFTSQSSFGSQRGFTRLKPSRGWTLPNVIGTVVGAIGGCVGGAAALTASLPSTALWTSAIVCGGSNKLMVNTSHYSYKPGQSGTNVDFQCLEVDGARDASFTAISALQTLVVGLALAGVLALGFLIRRMRRNEPVRPAGAVVVGALGLAALAVAAVILWHGLASSSAATQMAHGGNLSIRGNGDSQTIACNDGHLSIDGRNMTVTVTGHCAQLSVDGVISHITVDSVDAIEIDGINNVITYHSGSPTVTKSGGQNTVRQG